MARMAMSPVDAILNLQPRANGAFFYPTPLLSCRPTCISLDKPPERVVLLTKCCRADGDELRCAATGQPPLNLW